MPRTKQIANRVGLVAMFAAILFLLLVTPDRAAAPSHGDDGLVLYTIKSNSLVGIRATASNLNLATESVVVPGNVYRLYDYNSSSQFLVSLSPCASNSPCDLWLLEIDGDSLLLANDVVAAKFSGDSTEIAYLLSTGHGQNDLRIVSTDGTILYTTHNASLPSWSPDDSQIAFAAQSTGGSRDDSCIYLLNLNTGVVTILTSGHQDGNPIFHPSGDWILFVNGTRTGVASLWAVASSGGSPIQLTNIGLDNIDESFVPPPPQRASWSSDGTLLAFEHIHHSSSSIWAVEFDASGPLASSTILLGSGSSPRWIGPRTMAILTNRTQIAILGVRR